MDTLPALNWRYATKKFDPKKKLTDAQVHELLEVARLAPSSFGLAAWKFTLVNDPTLRARLREVAWGQPQVTDASHLLVFLAKDDVTEEDVEQYMALVAQERSIPREQVQGFADMLQGFRTGQTTDWLRTWTQKQTYIPLGMVMLAAAQRGIDTCPMEGFDSPAVTKLLEIPGYHAVTLLALGHRSSEDEYAGLAKVRAPASTVVVEK